MTTEALAVRDQGDRALDVVTATSARDMAERLVDIKQRLDLVRRFFKEVMVEGQDYGIIPGTDKPTLFKSGAEKLLEFYGFAFTIKELREVKDRETGYYECTAIVQLLDRRTGTIVAEGVGSANTMEAKFRYRWVPEEELPRGIDKSSLPTKVKPSPRGQLVFFRIENDEPWTLWNTVLKFSVKRGKVDATLSATRSSGLFTQDLEDLRDWIDIDTEFEEINGDKNPTPEYPSSSENSNPKTSKSPDMTYEQALETKITFGQYKNVKIGEMKQDRGYLKWLAANAKDQRLKKAAEIVLATKDDDDPKAVTPGEISLFWNAVQNAGANEDIAALVIRRLNPNLVAANGHIVWSKVRSGSKLFQQMCEVFTSGKWQEIFKAIEAEQTEKTSETGENENHPATESDEDDLDLDNLPF